MGNTAIVGGAPAAEIAGSLADGITFQNLSPSAPAYIGYDPSVNASAFSGYLAPGGSYTTPKGKNVWIYADSNCPIVYDYGTGSSPGAGSQVTVAGTVNVGNTPGVTVNGNVALAAGTQVGVSGSVNPSQTYSTLYNRGYVSVPYAPGSSGLSEAGVIGQTDVSTQQSLILSFNTYNGDTRFLIGGFHVYWYDQYGTYLSDEIFPGYCFGGLEVITPIKGAKVAVNLFVDSGLYGNYGFGEYCYVGTSSLLLPEQYYTAPGVQTGVRVSHASNNYPYINDEQLDCRVAGVQKISVSTPNAGIAYYQAILPSFSRLVNGAVRYTGTNASTYAKVMIGAWIPGRNSMDPSTPAGASSLAVFEQMDFSGSNQTFATIAQFFTAQFPKSPISLEIWSNSTGTTGTAFDVTLAYERY